MAAATSSSASSPSPPLSNSTTAMESHRHLLNKIRSHEVALAELSYLSNSSRAIYQKNGNIFFRTAAEKATTSEQRELDTAKSELQKLNLP